MFLQLPNLLSEAELATLEVAFASATFADGKSTADAPTRPAKNNLQMVRGTAEDPKRAEVDRLVIGALMRHEAVRMWALPKRIVRPVFSKYLPGMAYGWHTDNPVMAEMVSVRTDIAVTVFLSDPGWYEGGALLINASGGQASFRPARGTAVFYPATTIHAVEEVTSGERRAAVTWIQSMVSAEAQREVLRDINLASRLVRDKAANSDEARLLMKTYGNLFRMWAEL